jgi:hypothetical protein
MQQRLWRVFGALAIANVVVMFAAISVEGMTAERCHGVQAHGSGAYPARQTGGRLRCCPQNALLQNAVRTDERRIIKDYPPTA